MKDVLVGLPCLGRVEQTIQNTRRLINTAGSGVDWSLVLTIPEQDRADWELLGYGEVIPEASFIFTSGTFTYWESLQLIRDTQPPARLYAGLANDLLPGHEWLSRGVAAHRRSFPDGRGLLGFNDGIHAGYLSPHFLIDRESLSELGGWPIWYNHNYGDVEMCARMSKQGRYAKAPWAVLYHNHYITGAAGDQLYTHANRMADKDAQTWDRRRRELGVRFP